MFSFQNPSMLWLLLLMVPIAILYGYAVRSKKKTISKIGDELLVKELIQSYLPHRYFLQFLLFSFAIICIVVVLANPRIAGGKQMVERSGTDIMIALDVSNSMLAEDVTPNRLRRAKQFLGSLLTEIDQFQIGLVVFAGNAYLQMPLTPDHDAAMMYINAANPQHVETQGTSLTEALNRCSVAFENSENFKSIILITDGEDHDEDALEVAENLAKNGVVINTIGLGDPLGTTIKDPVSGSVKMDKNGAPVVTRLNEKLLQQIAKSTNGVYYRFENAKDGVNKVMSVLDDMKGRVTKDESNVEFTSLYYIFLLLALFLLLVERMISDKKRIANQVIKPSLVILLIFWCNLGLRAQTKEAQQLYAEGKYDIAAQRWELAVTKDPTYKNYYNYGNTLFRLGKYDAAAEAYDKAIGLARSDQDRASVLYNKGVAYQQAQKEKQSIEAYKSCLRLVPEDEMARHNLQKLLRKQEQDNQSQQQQSKQNQQQDNSSPTPSRLSQKQAEEKLDALRQLERNLQDKMRKQQPSFNKPEKDW